MLSQILRGWNVKFWLVVINTDLNFKCSWCSREMMKSWHRSDFRSMMTSSNGNIFRVTGHLCGEFTDPGEFPAQRPVARSFEVFFDLRLNKRLSKQSWGWWFETLSRSLWRQCDEYWPFAFCQGRPHLTGGLPWQGDRNSELLYYFC